MSGLIPLLMGVSGQIATGPSPGQTVTVTAAFSDGTNSTLTLQPGERKAFVAGNVLHGSAIYHSDALSVCIENCYMGTTGPLSGTFTVVAGGTTLFNGTLKIGAYKREPFWVTQPVAKTSPDWSAWPPRINGQQSSVYDAVIASNTGPGGIGIADPVFETTGERDDLGGPLWDVAYMTNPNPNNAVSVRLMADVGARWGVHAIDINTNDMVDLTNNPFISMATNVLGQQGNPIVAWTDDGSGTTLSQAQAHATYYNAAAAELYDTVFDHEEVGFWASYYGSLWQTPHYRSASGGTTFFGCQVRGKARCFEYLLLATKYAPAKWQGLFGRWITDCIADGTTRGQAQTGLAIDQLTEQSGADADMYSVWNQQILVAALGRCIDYGFTSAQWLLDYYAQPVFDSVLGDGQTPTICHEMASHYKYPWINTDGTYVQNYRGALELQASTDTGFNTALNAAENSSARMQALEPNDSNYIAGDFDNYPWSPTGYPCYVRVALVALVNHATDQTSANAAWQKFLLYYRADHSTDAKYDIVPNT